MNNTELTDKLDIILGCLIGSHIGNATPEHQLENLITELKANNNEDLGDVVESSCSDYEEGINMHCSRCDQSMHLHK